MSEHKKKIQDLESELFRLKRMESYPQGIPSSDAVTYSLRNGDLRVDKFRWSNHYRNYTDMESGDIVKSLDIAEDIVRSFEIMKVLKGMAGDQSWINWGLASQVKWYLVYSKIEGRWLIKSTFTDQIPCVSYYQTSEDAHRSALYLAEMKMTASRYDKRN